MRGSPRARCPSDGCATSGSRSFPRRSDRCTRGGICSAGRRCRRRSGPPTWCTRRTPRRSRRRATDSGWWSPSTTSRSSTFPNLFPWAWRWLYRFGLRAAVRRADAILTPSRNTAEDVLSSHARRPPQAARRALGGGVAAGSAGCGRGARAAEGPRAVRAVRRDARAAEEPRAPGARVPAGRGQRRAARAGPRGPARLAPRGADARAGAGGTGRDLDDGRALAGRAGRRVPGRRRVRLPVAVRGVRPAGRGGDGTRRADGGLLDDIGPRGGRRCRARREPPIGARDRQGDRDAVHGRRARREAGRARADAGRALLMGRDRAADPRRLRAGAGGQA